MNLKDKIAELEKTLPQEVIDRANEAEKKWSKSLPTKRNGLSDIKDTWVPVSGLESMQFIKNEFTSEKHLCQFIEDNIVDFVEKVFDLQYITHKREFDFNSKIYGIKPRVDFFITTDAGNIILECKKDKDLTGVISQILGYSCLAKSNNIQYSNLAILTTSYNDLLREVIYSYELPIDLYVFSKEHCLKLLTKKEYGSTEE